MFRASFQRLLRGVAAAAVVLLAATPAAPGLAAPVARPLSPDIPSVQPVLFHVRIENLSGNSEVPTPLSPIVWAVSDADGLLFTPGQVGPG